MTATEMIKKWDIELTKDGGLRIPGWIAKKMTKAQIEDVKTAKTEIIAELTAVKTAEIKAREDAAARLAANVPGLQALRDALSRREMYHEAFERMMDDEFNDGARPPKKPADDIDALNAQYPAAVAYLKAESWECASHYAKSSAGSKAKQAIADGADYNEALAQMEAEWQAHCDEHIWD